MLVQFGRRKLGGPGYLTGLIYYTGEFGFSCSGEKVEPGGNIDESEFNDSKCLF